MKTRQDLARTIAATAGYYDKKLDADVLTMMCDDLQDLNFESAINAYSTYRANPKNRTFPLPAQIREIVNPALNISAEAKAAEVASRIVGAVTKFGYNNQGKARDFIGNDGWEVVENCGGWLHICENLGLTLQPTTFQAQARNVLEAKFKYGNEAMQQSIGIMPHKQAIDGAKIPKQLGEILSNGLKTVPNGGD